MATTAAAKIQCDEAPMGICFHPSQPVLAVGLVNGDADLYQYSEVRGGEEPEWIVKRSIHCTPHTESCRAVVFDEPGTSLFAASSDHSISAVGTATGKLKRVHKDAHPAAISRLTCIGPHVIASGDEDGGVKIWDWRQRRATAEFDVHKDYISDFAFHSPSNSLIAVSGDGSLSVIDARRGKLKARSEDDGDDELLSAEVMKAGSKIVVGTQAGVLSLFSWGHFKDCSDRFPGHPMSVSALVKYDEDTLLSASSDGMIRILNILPNKLLGVLGMHSDDPIECMAMAQDRSALATTSHDNRVMLWSLNMLQGVDNNEDDDKDDAGDVEGGGAAMGGRAAAEALEASEPQAREPSTTARPSTRAADHATDDCAPEGSEDDSDEEARPQKKGKNKRKRAKTRMKGRPAPANKKSSFFDGLL